MERFLIYCVQLSLLLAGVYLFYCFILRPLTCYTINRWYLLIYSISAMVLPLVKFTSPWSRQAVVPSGFTNWVPETVTTMIQNNSVQTGSGITPAAGIFLIFVAGSVFMLFRVTILLLSLYRIKTLAFTTSINGLKISQVNKNITPFSFGGTVFINQHRHSPSELKEILQHEMVHVKQLHSIDIILAEIICILNWFNPFAWLLKKAIRQNLEFIADENVLQNGVNKKQYQYLLLKVTAGDRHALAAPFNYSSLKKRIVMMNKSKNTNLELSKLFLLVPVTFLMLLAFSSKAQKAKLDSDLASMVKSLDIKNNKAVIILTDGSKENYDLRIASEKNAFEAKYGTVPVAPAKHDPYPKMKPPAQNTSGVENVSLTKDNKATVSFKDGRIENYDLNILLEKTLFEKSYGKLLPSAPPPVPSAPPPVPSALPPVRL